ncbi:putative ankyrin repeat-containing protein [Neospora caninum Liverpool]|uniref:Ankyrin repeat-containing protein, putative n=1 Tax=Neospora caninum (strain Liverpool) TaxID=572307 RepID=F0VGI3_NEOCL|nr:putative ankyrin repeat-containing protein [Neospora caninum Liverpool]CBZ52827.1 putative ankyrin repeat-containing protein [Neospora caninum Liverpool]CEL66807.1 TPA: ankyrin repeat-containing protein, putative [Neospora caninum Liverpool]|eukprot:XP_003882859.1 putative ankyrin repeat-containing protein [Neospora caninum Liverpool]
MEGEAGAESLLSGLRGSPVEFASPEEGPESSMDSDMAASQPSAPVPGLEAPFLDASTAGLQVEAQSPVRAASLQSNVATPEAYCEDSAMDEAESETRGSGFSNVEDQEGAMREVEQVASEPEIAAAILADSARSPLFLATQRPDAETLGAPTEQGAACAFIPGLQEVFPRAERSVEERAVTPQGELPAATGSVTPSACGPGDAKASQATPQPEPRVSVGCIDTPSGGTVQGVDAGAEERQERGEERIASSSEAEGVAREGVAEGEKKWEEPPTQEPKACGKDPSALDAEAVDAEVAARAAEAVDIAVAAGAVDLCGGRSASMTAAVGFLGNSAQLGLKGAPTVSPGGTSVGAGPKEKSAAGAGRKKASVPTPNDVWKDRLKLLEGFLDVESILLLKQCARVFYRHKYRPHDGVLCFHNFRGYDPKVVMETVLPLASRSIHPAIRERGLTLDFSHCTLMKDASVARLMDAVHGEKEENQILGNLKALCLDFCSEITDKGLSAMLTTYLPHLERVSVRCARSTELTFVSVMKHLSAERWPKLIYFDASFTNIWLEAATAIADQLFMNAARLTALHRDEEERKRREAERRAAPRQGVRTPEETREQPAGMGHAGGALRLAEHAVAEETCAPDANAEMVVEGTECEASMPVDNDASTVSRLSSLQGPEITTSPLSPLADMHGTSEPADAWFPEDADARARDGKARGSGFFVTPSLEIIGSVASKSLLLKVGMEAHYCTFCQAVKTGDWETVSLVTKRLQKELSELAASAPFKSSRLILLQQFRGSELLVNAPFTVETSEEGGVNVLTLPISIAIQRMDTETLGVLLKRGAKIEVCDYLGKSPLYRACEVGRRDMVETLLVDYGASPEAPDVRSELFPLHTAVKKKDVEIVQLLLRRGASLDLKCPAVKSYKSALFVACEVNAPEIIQLCLEAGADPNWKGHNSYTPTLLAYQLNSAWLPHFLDAGAGIPKSRRWVLTEVLSCAIAKNDLVSVELLVRKFPDLLSRNHQLWSRPLIQAAKQGKADIISALLAAGSAVDAKKEDGQTALLAAAEEDFVVCVHLLLDAGADINGTNNAEVVKLLLNRGCDVNIGDKANGEVPLMMCIRMRNEKMALQILELGKNLDLEKRDHQGSTALLYAMFFGQYVVAGILMDRGADVTVSDRAGNSAYAIVNERLMTQGADKRVLRKFLRLYKNAREGKRPRVVAGLANDVHPAEDSSASGGDSGPDAGQAIRSSRRETSSSRSSRRTLSIMGSSVSTMGSTVSAIAAGGSATRAVILSSGVRTPPREDDGPHMQRSGSSPGAQETSGKRRGGGRHRKDGHDMDVDEEGRPGAGARSKSSGAGGKKLKLEPKSVLNVARLPIALFRAAKAK